MELTEKEEKKFMEIMNDKYSKGAFLGQVGGMALDPLHVKTSFKKLLKARLEQLVEADDIYNTIIDKKTQEKQQIKIENKTEEPVMEF